MGNEARSGETTVESQAPETGIAAAGSVPWGSHFCHFYRDAAALDALIGRYFAAGIANGEACVWFVSGSERARAAREQLGHALRGLEALEQSRQLEICDVTADPSLAKFDSSAVLDAWMERFRTALARGFAGLRVTGNTVWAPQAGWSAFMEHERKVKETFGRSRMLCLCTFCAADHDAGQVFDAARQHDFVLGSDEQLLLPGESPAVERAPPREEDVARLQRQLDEKTQDLDAALNAREEFLSLLGHELRNPLGPLRNAARIIRMTAAADATLTQATDIIERHVSHLSRLVDDLLDLGRLTRGTMSLLKDEVQLDSIIASALQVARPLIDFRGQELILSLPTDTLYLNADAVRLSQVFSNILDNAAAYTPRGGKIWLSAEYEDGAAVVRVRDNGMGIPVHLLSRIFALFVQGPRRPDRFEGGLGLGLALVKRLVELHGGTVQAFSEGEGRGAEFIVRLPVVSRVRRAESHPGAGQAQASGPRLRVLVADDHQDSSEMLAQLLALHGHEVKRAATGPAALEAAKSFEPDAVLLDIGLPGMDGYEVARRLRQSESTRHAVVIAVTGYGSSRDLRESSQAGIDHHLVKPVEPDRLFGILDAIAPMHLQDSGDGKVLSFGARLRRAAKVLVHK